MELSVRPDGLGRLTGALWHKRKGGSPGGEPPFAALDTGPLRARVRRSYFLTTTLIVELWPPSCFALAGKTALKWKVPFFVILIETE